MDFAKDLLKIKVVLVEILLKPKISKKSLSF
jgi:hypothetical protein